MFLRILVLFPLFALCALTLAGCKGAMVYNVKNRDIIPASSRALSVDQVREAILRAGEGLGWKMEEQAGGNVACTWIMDERMAKVDVFYGVSSYSMLYRDSRGFDFDGSSINEDYNILVKTLEQSIGTQLILATR